MRSIITPVVAFFTIAVTANSTLAQIPWQNDLRTAHTEAKQEGKLLLMHFYSDNCVWCDRLEAGAFQSSALATAIGKDFVPVKIHAGKNPLIASTFRVTRFPTDVIVTTDGAVLSHGVSPQDPQQFVNLLAQHATSRPDRGAVAQSPASQPAARQTPAALAHTPATQPPAPATQPAAPSRSPAAATVSIPTGPPSRSNPYAPAEVAKTEPDKHPQAAHRASHAAETETDPIAAHDPITGHDPIATNQVPERGPASDGGFQLPNNFGGTPASTVGHRAESFDSAVEFASEPRAAGEAIDRQVASQESDTGSAKSGLQIPAGLEADLVAQAEAPAAAELSAFNAPKNNTASKNNLAPDTDLAPQAQRPTPPVALQGFCPVSLVKEEHWVEGDAELGLIHMGQLYLFADQAALEEFRGNPDPYTPVLNGNDVVLFFDEHRVVEGRRDWGLYIPEINRIFLFANEQTMNHFFERYQDYVPSALFVMQQAAAEANRKLR